MKVQIWTDGSCWPTNGGPGGWAAILKSGEHYKEISGGYPNTTIGQMELEGVHAALRSLKGGPHEVEITTDSQYVQGVITGVFRAKKHPFLVKQIRELISQHSVTVNWVRGHSGCPENERCDVLAKEEREKWF